MGGLLGVSQKEYEWGQNHVEKDSCQIVGSFGYPESIMMRYKWYQSKPLLVQCDSQTKPTQAGGHVTPETDKGCISHDNEWLLAASRQNLSLYHNERDLDVMQV